MERWMCICVCVCVFLHTPALAIETPRLVVHKLISCVSLPSSLSGPRSTLAQGPGPLPGTVKARLSIWKGPAILELAVARLPDEIQHFHIAPSGWQEVIQTLIPRPPAQPIHHRGNGVTGRYHEAADDKDEHEVEDVE